MNNQNDTIDFGKLMQHEMEYDKNYPLNEVSANWLNAFNNYLIDRYNIVKGHYDLNELICFRYGCYGNKDVEYTIKDKILIKYENHYFLYSVDVSDPSSVNKIRAILGYELNVMYYDSIETDSGTLLYFCVSTLNNLKILYLSVHEYLTTRFNFIDEIDDLKSLNKIIEDTDGLELANLDDCIEESYSLNEVSNIALSIINKDDVYESFLVYKNKHLIELIDDLFALSTKDDSVEYVFNNSLKTKDVKFVKCRARYIHGELLVTFTVVCNTLPREDWIKVLEDISEYQQENELGFLLE